MGFQRKKSRGICLAAAAFLALTLSGCGRAGERTQGAIQMIGELDYQGALEQLDAAEADGEDGRLVNRARGIAYMGLTDYEQAAFWFEEALGESGGVVQNVDYDLNFYLAAAYTKNGRYSDAEDIYDAVLALRPGRRTPISSGGTCGWCRAIMRGRRRISTRSSPWTPPIMTGS